MRDHLSNVFGIESVQNVPEVYLIGKTGPTCFIRKILRNALPSQSFVDEVLQLELGETRNVDGFELGHKHEFLLVFHNLLEELGVHHIVVGNIILTVLSESLEHLILAIEVHRYIFSG